MFGLIKDFLGMSTTKIVLAVFAILFCLLLLVRFPVEYDWVSYEVKDYIKTTKTTKYILQSEVHKDGVKVKVTTKTYYVQLDESPAD